MPKFKFIHSFIFLLFLLAAAGLVIASASFQLSPAEVALVNRWGKPSETVETPGLHWKWPYPIESVWKTDLRLRTFSPKSGQPEEIQFQDGARAAIHAFAVWQIQDPQQFRRQNATIATFEAELEPLFRSVRNHTLGQFKLSDLTGPDNLKWLNQAEQATREALQQALKSYGIRVLSVGLDQIMFPESVNNTIINRMRQTREAERTRLLAEADQQAEAIKSETEAAIRTKEIEARRQAQLETVRLASEASNAFETLSKYPQLAALIRKMQLLESAVDQDTTLILDTSQAPFDLLRPEVEQKLNPGESKRGQQTP